MNTHDHTSAIAALGANRTPARYYAESDGDEHARTYYVSHTWGRERIDCVSMASARKLAAELNQKQHES
jgi:hypothetical protein